MGQRVKVCALNLRRELTNKVNNVVNHPKDCDVARHLCSNIITRYRWVVKKEEEYSTLCLVRTSAPVSVDKIPLD